MRTPPLSKRQAQAAFAALHKFAQQYTSHKTFCPRLRAAVNDISILPQCNCGYQSALARLKEELEHIRSGQPERRAA